MNLKLTEIFQAPNGSQQLTMTQLFELNFQPAFIEMLTKQLGLPFVDSPEEGNVCYAESRALRADYRSTFSRADVLDIIRPQLWQQRIDLQQQKVVVPDHQDSFFSLAYRQQLALRAQKKRLRTLMLEQREQLPRTERNRHSAKICDQLWDIIVEQEPAVIHSFLPMGSEVNVLPLLQRALDAGITVVAPRALRKRKMQNLIVESLQKMEAGIFGTYHPRDATEYTGSYGLIIVAGLAFDHQGYRVGYGGGYYDTFLANQPAAFKAGVCFPFQKVDTLPIESHDVRLDVVIG
jgi:5-formyltetrahydrofolate cyclo-ligase